MYGGIFRRNLFWLLDKLKGNPIGNHYQDIKEMMENDNLCRSRAEDYLQKLLNHATSTVDCFKPYSGCRELMQFPVMNKLMIKNNPDQYTSSIYKNKPLHYMRTSGSTGAPFVFSQDMNKRHRVLASLIYFGQQCGYEIGMKNVYFGVWAKEDRKKRWDNFKKNMIVIDIISLNENQLEEMRNRLKKDKKIVCVLGYASTLDRLAKYLLEKGDDPEMFAVKTIISSAEKLNESTRQELKKVFGCDIVSRYSNSENGILAQECVSKLEFHINSADYIFEILKMDSDEPAAVGEMGRIVITDLFNYAMPLIRYDTGDIGVLAKKPECSWNTPVFDSMDGRLTEVLYDTKGEPISPLWDFDLDDFEDLKQYQFVQEEEKRYVVNVNGAKGIYSDELLINHMKQTLGEDAKVEINHVDEIPILASGKFKQNINNYIKK